MTVYLKHKTGMFDATGEYDIKTNALVLKSGSLVSEDIHYSETFRGARTIEKQRKQYLVDRVVQDDLVFKSPSTAANFVTGRSCNGMIMWKTKEGKNIKNLISE